MVATDPLKYVPVLKWHAGEKRALKELNDRLRQSIVPLIELVNDEGDDPNDLVSSISQTWGERTAYLDVGYRPVGFAHTALTVIANTDSAIDIIPVVQLGETQQIIIEDIKTVALKYNNGFAIRIKTTTDHDYSLLKKEIDLLIGQIAGPSPKKDKIDIIIDFGYLESAEGYTDALEGIANNISINEWRRVVISSGAFTPDLTPFKPNEDNFLPRLEWQLWQEHNHLLGRKTIFSDYAVRNPEVVDKTPSLGSKSVRYTLENEYQIFRGTLSDKPFKYLAHSLNIKTLHGDNFGNSYSWGDEAINEKAAQLEKCLKEGKDPENYLDFHPGNPAEWVAISVNHHLAVVLKSNL